jgi:hypothetical protein
MTSKIFNTSQDQTHFKMGNLYTTERGTVVLCTEDSKKLIGVVVVTPTKVEGRPIGEHYNHWDSNQFTLFSGTIELSQEKTTPQS